MKSAASMRARACCYFFLPCGFVCAELQAELSCAQDSFKIITEVDAEPCMPELIQCGFGDAPTPDDDNTTLLFASFCFFVN